MVKFLVERGACIFSTTLSDQETAAEKCEEDGAGFDSCSEYLFSKWFLNILLYIITIFISFNSLVYFFNSSYLKINANYKNGSW